MPTAQTIIRLSAKEKAEIAERCNALGVSLSEAFRNGALLYLTALELRQKPGPKRGRPRKEAGQAA